MVAEIKTGQTSMDGVNRLPPNDIKVVVIGAGIGGLQAALECWRKGCEVVVLEKAAELSPLGRHCDEETRWTKYRLTFD